MRTKLKSIARIVAVSQPVAGPSSIASSSTSAYRLYHRSNHGDRRQRQGDRRLSRTETISSGTIRSRLPLRPADRLELVARAFSTSSELRSSHDAKDKPLTNDGEENRTRTRPETVSNVAQDSTAGSGHLRQVLDEAKSGPESAAESPACSHVSSDTMATASGPTLDVSIDSKASVNEKSSKSNASGRSSACSPASWLDQFRNGSSFLPSFDAPTSTTSLSSLLSTASNRTSELTTHLRSRLSYLSTQYNTYSGYSTIETLKSRIVSLEQSLETKRSRASTAKTKYLDSVRERSSSQRETNDLLSRKNNWTETDLSRYTELLRKEHTVSQQEKLAEQELERTEGEVQKAFDELMKAVMVRYHEEQIWSDRMRGWSTYGSLLVAGLNAVLFIMAILVVEPYKRKKLAETFEKRLVAAEVQSRQLILHSVDRFQESLTAALTPATAASPVAESEVDGAAPVERPEALMPPRAEGLEPAEIVEAEIVEAENVQGVVGCRSIQRQEEERLVFASTVGVVVGAALSLIISACWS